jgi:hypothetical protein
MAKETYFRRKSRLQFLSRSFYLPEQHCKTTSQWVWEDSSKVPPILHPDIFYRSYIHHIKTTLLAIALAAAVVADAIEISLYRVAS